MSHKTITDKEFIDGYISGKIKDNDEFIILSDNGMTSKIASAYKIYNFEEHRRDNYYYFK